MYTKIWFLCFFTNIKIEYKDRTCIKRYGSYVPSQYKIEYKNRTCTQRYGSYVSSQISKQNTRIEHIYKDIYKIDV